MNHDNDYLSKQLDRLDKKVEAMDKTAQAFRHEIRRELSKFMDEIRKELDTFRDFMNRQLGKEEGMAQSQRSGNVLGVSRETWDVIKWLILIIGALVGVNLT